MKDRALTPLLDQLSEAANRLNEASDSVNEILATVEARLVEANVGIEVWVRPPLHSSDSHQSGGEESWTSDFLGFAKMDGKWQLAVKAIRVVNGFFEGDTSCPYQNEYVTAGPSPLAKAPRDIRIAALERLPDLMENLTTAAMEQTATIERAKLTA